MLKFLILFLVGIHQTYASCEQAMALVAIEKLLSRKSQFASVGGGWYQEKDFLPASCNQLKDKLSYNLKLEKLYQAQSSNEKIANKENFRQNMVKAAIQAEFLSKLDKTVYDCNKYRPRDNTRHSLDLSPGLSSTLRESQSHRALVGEQQCRQIRDWYRHGKLIENVQKIDCQESEVNTDQSIEQMLEVLADVVDQGDKQDYQEKIRQDIITLHQSYPMLLKPFGVFSFELSVEGTDLQKLIMERAKEKLQKPISLMSPIEIEEFIQTHSESLYQEIKEMPVFHQQIQTYFKDAVVAVDEEVSQLCQGKGTDKLWGVSSYTDEVGERFKNLCSESEIDKNIASFKSNEKAKQRLMIGVTAVTVVASAYTFGVPLIFGAGAIGVASAGSIAIAGGTIGTALGTLQAKSSIENYYSANRQVKLGLDSIEKLPPAQRAIFIDTSMAALDLGLGGAALTGKILRLGKHTDQVVVSANKSVDILANLNKTQNIDPKLLKIVSELSEREDFAQLFKQLASSSEEIQKKFWQNLSKTDNPEFLLKGIIECK